MVQNVDLEIRLLRDPAKSYKYEGLVGPERKGTVHAQHSQSAVSSVLKEIFGNLTFAAKVPRLRISDFSYNPPVEIGALIPPILSLYFLRTSLTYVAFTNHNLHSTVSCGPRH